MRLHTNLEVIGSLRGEAAFRRTNRQVLAVDYPGASEEELDDLALRTHFLDAQGRVHPLYDVRLLSLIADFEHDDVMLPQWPLFDALAHAPLIVMRTERTGQLSTETFEEMLVRRRDVQGFIIEGQGSPALLDVPEDVRPIADLVRGLIKARPRRGR